jgi:hypothetical protein
MTLDSPGYPEFRRSANVEDRRNQSKEDIGPTVQFPGELGAMEAITSLGGKLGADEVDRELIDKYLKARGK